jgi:hypothetical protein
VPILLVFDLLTILLARKDGKVTADLQQTKERLSAVAAELKKLKESDVRGKCCTVHFGTDPILSLLSRS